MYTGKFECSAKDRTLIMTYRNHFERLTTYMKTTSIYTVSTIVFIGIVLLAVGFYAYTKNKSDGVQTYSNARYGISFSYPKDYVLKEHEVTEGMSGTVATITEDDAPLPENGEGPTAITVSMYDGSAATSSLPVWIKTSPYSNFSLARQAEPGITQVAGQDAYLYTWDGLYQGTTVVTKHAGNIIMFSVTYDGETDLEKRAAFTDLVANAIFTQPGSTLQAKTQ